MQNTIKFLNYADYVIESAFVLAEACFFRKMPYTFS